MKSLARLFLLTLFLSVPLSVQAQDPGSEEQSSGKPFYGYAGWGALAFGALYGACRASRR
jgi:hypothetical protein